MGIVLSCMIAAIVMSIIATTINMIAMIITNAMIVMDAVIVLTTSTRHSAATKVIAITITSIATIWENKKPCHAQ